MVETFFGLVSAHGLWIVALSAYFSCLAVPVPTFAVMLAGGAFAAAGDFVLWQVWAVAWGAAVAGDQTGFRLGRWGGRRLLARISADAGRARLLARAQLWLDRWGGLGVFLTTWAVAPLGPWVNLMAGVAGLSPLRFLAWDAAGEAIWVSIYVLLGYRFGAQLGVLAELVGNWAGLVSTLAVAAMALWVLLTRLRRRRVRRG